MFGSLFTIVLIIILNPKELGYEYVDVYYRTMYVGYYPYHRAYYYDTKYGTTGSVGIQSTTGSI